MVGWTEIMIDDATAVSKAGELVAQRAALKARRMEEKLAGCLVAKSIVGLVEYWIGCWAVKTAEPTVLHSAVLKAD